MVIVKMVRGGFEGERVLGFIRCYLGLLDLSVSLA